MKSDRLSKYFKALCDRIVSLFSRNEPTQFSNPRRYRLDFIAENTFNRVWTLRFSRPKVILFSFVVVAAIGALMFVGVFYTPVRKLLPGRLEGDLRSRYVEMALKLDSLETLTKANDRFINNLHLVFNDYATTGDVPGDDAVAMAFTNADSLLMASEAERRFVQNYESSERYNLSVLTPIAAEGMAFYSPAPGVMSEPKLVDEQTAVLISEPSTLRVSAVYRGTIVLISTAENATKTVVIQHPNDFVSIYSGVKDCFVKTGSKVIAGESLGHSGGENVFRFELWHNGSPTTPTDYISF